MGDKRRVGAYEMIVLCEKMAREIRASQAALIRAGDRDEPHEGQIRRAEVLDAIADFVTRARPFASDIRAMFDTAPRTVLNMLKDRGDEG